MPSKNQDQIYEVECLKDRRFLNGRVEYLVKWKNWSTKFDTWEPTENIIDRSLIEKFEQNLGIAKTKRGRAAKSSPQQQRKSTPKPQQKRAKRPPTPMPTKEKSSKKPRKITFAKKEPVFDLSPSPSTSTFQFSTDNSTSSSTEFVTDTTLTQSMQPQRTVYYVPSNMENPLDTSGGPDFLLGAANSSFHFNNQSSVAENLPSIWELSAPSYWNVPVPDDLFAPSVYANEVKEDSFSMQPFESLDFQYLQM